MIRWLVLIAFVTQGLASEATTPGTSGPGAELDAATSGWEASTAPSESASTPVDVVQEASEGPAQQSGTEEVTAGTLPARTSTSRTSTSRTSTSRTLTSRTSFRLFTTPVTIGISVKSSTPTASSTTPGTPELATTTTTTTAAPSTIATASSAAGTAAGSVETTGTTTISGSSETSGTAGTTSINATIESAGTSETIAPAGTTVNGTIETAGTSETTGTAVTTSFNGTTESAGSSSTTAGTTVAANDTATGTELTTTSTTSTTGTTIATTITAAGTPTASPTEPAGTTAEAIVSSTPGTRPATSKPNHMCSPAVPCADPHSHCVSVKERNICLCRLGYQMNYAVGLCQLVVPATTRPTSQSNESTTPTSGNVDTSAQRRVSLSVSDLSSHEKVDVVSMVLTPAGSAVQWIVAKDVAFRTAIAHVLNAFNYSGFFERDAVPSISVNVSLDDVIYLDPSPLVISEGILVSFLVLDRHGGSDQFRPAQYLESVSFRQRREQQQGRIVYFPEKFVRAAVINKQSHLEAELEQNVSSLARGFEQLVTVERLASSTLFERRLDVFLPLILAAALGFTALALGFACLRAKSRSTWDPPAGVVYGKTSLLREDPVGSAARSATASGCDLASDEQCRDGEEHKHSIRIGQDDVWVTSGSQLKTQFEDTKL